MASLSSQSGEQDEFDEDEYEYEVRMGMTSKVNEALHLSLRYQLEYDRSLPEDRREDQRVVSSVGIDF